MGAAVSSTAPPTRMIANMKLASLAYLLVSPSLVFSFSLPRPQEESSEARQFSDDEIVNYGVWGFIAGLMDYFIRQQFATTAAAETTTMAMTTVAPTTAASFRRKKKKKNKKTRKNKNRAEAVEAEEEMAEEVEEALE